MSKYYLKCVKCGHETPTFSVWFKQNQTCPKCGSKHSEVYYNTDYSHLNTLIKSKPKSFWNYMDYLPLENEQNQISCGEGAIPIEHWQFLSDYAKRVYHIDCKVYVYRNDLNQGTQTFKDVAASLAASLFKENGIQQYTAASTGNTATAFSKYLALAGVNFTVFVPQNINRDSEVEMISYGQQVIRCGGDYSFAKKLAAEYASKYHILISAGNIDPIRVEAKKTMVFEFMRQMGKMPDIYFQAVSGGTGPIAIDKGVREIQSYYPEVKLPKMILIQQDYCNPMVSAWENAKIKGFPKGYEQDYPVIDNPKTEVSILSTGNPGMYPVIAPIVRKSGGTFLTIKESDLPNFAKLIAYEKKIHLGPASLVCMAGFFKALQEHQIENGQTILINIGEGADRAKDFIQSIYEECSLISDINQCSPHNIETKKSQIWSFLNH